MRKSAFLLAVLMAAAIQNPLSAAGQEKMMKTETVIMEEFDLTKLDNLGSVGVGPAQAIRKQKESFFFRAFFTLRTTFLGLK